MFIRGIGQTDATPAVDPGVGIYIDDVYMGRSVGGAMEFRDIANVQILRGPQGTLFGRNTIGGAVLLTTNEPGDDAGNSVRVGVGEDNLREAFGAFDIPLGDNWSARLALGGAPARRLRHARVRRRGSRRRRHVHRPGGAALETVRRLLRSRCAATTPRKTRTARRSCSSR